MTASSPSQPAKGPQVFTVTELTKVIRGVLEVQFDSVWVEGEISNLRVPSSGHAYFVLKDEKAQVRCVLFKNYRVGAKYKPEDGDHVVLFGRLSVYEPRGEYQVIVEALEPRGLGALQKAFEQLKEKLAKEGLFDPARKRPLPEFPWKVGVVTSATGAAVRDILNILRRRNPKVSVLLHPVKVQGEGAAEEIAAAIETLNRIEDIDLLIVGRGGGSIEDLWAFNEEIVARAIAGSRLPVISAVGHEIDFTIADFVADLRAPTPSAAAELAVPLLSHTVDDLRQFTDRMMESLGGRVREYRELLRRLIDRRFFREPLQVLAPLAQRMDDLNLRLFRGLGQWVVLQRARLAGLSQQLTQASPGRNLARLEERRAHLHHLLLRQTQTLARTAKERLESFEQQLRRQMAHGLTLEKKRFEAAAKNLNALSPLAILDRGYSICLHAGAAVKSSEDVAVGDPVRVRLARGELDCKVEHKH